MITRKIESEDTTQLVHFDPERMEAVLDDRTFPFEWESVGKGIYHMRTGSQNYRISLISFDPPDQWLFQVNGKLYRTVVRDEKQQLLMEMELANVAKSGITELKAPMPGKVLEISVTPGTQVSAGQPLVILEAMKMENELRSPHSGIIEKINISHGESVEKNELLLIINRS